MTTRLMEVLLHDTKNLVRRLQLQHLEEESPSRLSNGKLHRLQLSLQIQIEIPDSVGIKNPKDAPKLMTLYTFQGLQLLARQPKKL